MLPDFQQWTWKNDRKEQRGAGQKPDGLALKPNLVGPQVLITKAMQTRQREAKAQYVTGIKQKGQITGGKKEKQIT